jgi:rubredoxin
MTEAEWIASNDPAAMLRYIESGRKDEGMGANYPLTPCPVRVSDRKLQLFTEACRADAFSPSAAQAAAVLRDIIGNPFRPVVCPECDPEAPGLSKYWRPHPCNGCNGYGIPLSWLTPTVQGVARRAYDEHDFAALPILADALEDAGCDNEDILSHCRGEECETCDGEGVRWHCKTCRGIYRVSQGEPVCPMCEYNRPVEARLCPDCKGEKWLRGPHVRGCWAVDLLLGKE